MSTEIISLSSVKARNNLDILNTRRTLMAVIKDVSAKICSGI